MKQIVEKRKPSGIVDYIALALTTFGVGYIPGAPGTYGSAVGVAIYIGIQWLEAPAKASGIGAGLSLELIGVLPHVFHYALNAVFLTLFCLIGIWASDRTAPIFG